MPGLIFGCPGSWITSPAIRYFLLLLLCVLVSSEDFSTLKVYTDPVPVRRRLFEDPRDEVLSRLLDLVRKIKYVKVTVVFDSVAFYV
jgi:hypothetical protein